MTRKKILRRILYLILLIFVLNFLASKFYLYSSIWYFDMPMHFLGGVWLGFLCTYLLWPIKDLSTTVILKIITGVLLVGLSWELFEIIFINYIAHMPFNTLDTLSDLCFDLAGGFTTVLYLYKRIMPAIETEV